MVWTITPFGWAFIIGACITLGLIVSTSTGLWRWYRKAFDHSRDVAAGAVARKLTPVFLSDTAEADYVSKAKLRDAIEHGQCPDCQHKGFYLGPEGGMSQNIMCANPECCSAFNVAQGMGQVIYADRIPNDYWNPKVRKDRAGKVVA